MKKPICVFITDLQLNLNTLEIGRVALVKSLIRADKLKVPLFIGGDLNDTKAIIRAEVANMLLFTFAEYANVQVYILVGNHDLINEKAFEHGLQYLNNEHVHIIDRPVSIMLDKTLVKCIPYQTSNEVFTSIVSQKYDSEKLIFMHQGVQGAVMGDYVQDKSSVHPDVLKDHKVYSGHYHRHQTVGTVTYIGSPYTISFGESSDGLKGYAEIYDDYSYTFIPLIGLRRHIIREIHTTELYSLKELLFRDKDLLWIKIHGLRSDLQQIDKQMISNIMSSNNFRLDLIPDVSEQVEHAISHLTDDEILDTLINRLSESNERKQRLMHLWRSLLNET